MALRIFSVTSGTADPDAVARRGWWGTWIRAYRTIHLAEEIKVAAGGVLPVPIHIEILPLGVSADPSRSAGTIRERLEQAGVAGVGKLPLLVDDASGEKIFESTAICVYLCKRAGGLLEGEDDLEKVKVLQWLCFAETIPAIRPTMVLGGEKDGLLDGMTVAELKAKALSGIRGQIQTVEEHLKANPTWQYLVASGFSAADCGIIHALNGLDYSAYVDFAAFPLTYRYMQRVRARPGYKRAYVTFTKSAKL